MSESTEDFPPAPGTLLAGKYAVVGVIGTGGMGVVVEAQHERLGRPVALKLLKPDHRTVPEVTSRFEREARAAARLEGPHVARVLDVDSLPDGSPFMVMELLRGHDLEEELKQRGGRLPIREAVSFVLEACAAMSEAHRLGIVHRDLKPANLFVSVHEERRSLKVLDFGISKVTNDVNAAMTTTQSAFGTPLYMSPEQVRSVKTVDHRTDIWALGVILYELLTGNTPFAQASSTAIFVSIAVDVPVPIGKVRPEVPPGLVAVVMRALAKDPHDRFADVDELASALAPFAGEAGLADGASLVDEAAIARTSVLRAVSRPGSGRALAIVVGCLVLGAVLFLGVRGIVAADAGSPTAAQDPVTPTADARSPAPSAVTASAAPSVAASAEPTVVRDSETPAQSAPTARPKTSSSAKPRPSGAPIAKPPPARPPAEDDPKYL